MMSNGLHEQMNITDVLLPEDEHVIIMAGAYMLLFLLGTSGNVGVLTTIRYAVSHASIYRCNRLLPCSCPGTDYDISGRYALLKNGPNSADPTMFV